MRIVASVLTVVVASGCGQAPPARPLAARVIEIADVNTPGAYVDTVALSRDGSRVAIGQRNGSIRVWTPASGTEPATFGVSRHAVADLAFAPSGDVLASLAVGNLTLWRPGASPSAWTELANLPLGHRCSGLRFDGLGERLAVMCAREVVIVAVSGPTAIARFTSSHREELTSFDLAANGQRLITAGHEGDVTVWDAISATPLHTFSVARSRRPGPLPRGLPEPEVWAVLVALSPDGAKAAAVTIEGTVYAWDVMLGTEILTEADREAGGPPGGALRFTEDGRLLAPTNDRRGMRLFDLTRKTSRLAGTGAKNLNVVAITDDAAGFAVVTSAMERGKLVYDVEVWRMEPATGS